MHKDKYNKPFMPGQAAVDKQEREARKAKARAKRARKNAPVETVEFFVPDPENMKIVPLKIERKPQFVVREEDLKEAANFEKEYLMGVDYAAIERREMKRLQLEPDTETNMRLLPPNGPTFSGKFRMSDRQFENMLDVLGALFGLERMPKPLEDLFEEFEGLMQNHERLMSHFR